MRTGPSFNDGPPGVARTAAGRTASAHAVTSTSDEGNRASDGARSADGAGRPGWHAGVPWLSTAVRLVLAAVALWAGIAKIHDLEGSVRAVRAYELLPGAVADVVGYGLPVVEIILGLLLLAGLLTRYAALAEGLLMLAFVAGVVSAWSRGLSIDCGCFGGGGAVDPEETQYVTVIARDAALALAAAYLVRWPRSRLSADAALRL